MSCSSTALAFVHLDTCFLKAMKAPKLITVGLLHLLVLSFVVFAQNARPDFNRRQTFDAQHYTIRVNFDRSNKKVLGDTTVSLKPLSNGFQTVALDAVGLIFESVKLEPSGTDLKFRTVPGQVLVTLDRPYGPEDTVAIRLKYTAVPKKGIYFVSAETGKDRVNHSAQIWTQGEADEARHWFPSFDFPSDKATTEEYITAEDGETVVGNGEFLGKDVNPNGTVTWHYKMPVPHSTYLVSFVIGKYSKIDDQYGEVPLAFYVYPGKEDTARKAFGKTKEMIRVFEGLTGVKFPYNKYDQTIVAKFQFGGMENITATTMADTEIFYADMDFGANIVLDLVSHELAHSWFGDLVTCRNWAELWLNEGFATYMEAAYREAAFGRGDYMQKVRSNAAQFLVDDTFNRKRHPLFNLRAGNVAELFDNPYTTYNKGGAVLHMLREQVGTENFWKGVNIYLNRHKFANVESTDLKQAIEEASGQDLQWFFDQWIYSSGAPNLDVRQVYRSRTKTLELTVLQTQVPNGNVPAVFRLPMEISVKAGSTTIKQDLDIRTRRQTFSFKVGVKPSEISIDPQDKIILKNLRVRPLVVRS